MKSLSKKEDLQLQKQNPKKNKHPPLPKKPKTDPPKKTKTKLLKKKPQNPKTIVSHSPSHKKSESCSHRLRFVSSPML